MKIAPIDLLQKTFTQAFRGYEPQEVSAFLEQVRDEMEENLKRIHALETDLQARDRELTEHRGRDQAIRDTLLLAQKMVDDVRKNAEAEARLTLQEAALKAEQIEQDALRRRLAVLGEIEQLKAARARHLATVRAALETHRTLVEAIEDEVRDGDREGAKLAFLGGGRTEDAPPATESETRTQRRSRER